MEVVTKYTYLGLQMQDIGLERNRGNKKQKTKQCYGRLSSKVGFRANTYETTRGLWKGVAVPSIMYGMEVIKMNMKEVDELEVIQNKVARMGLGANKWTAKETLRGEMGWSTFEERIDKAKVKYRMRLEFMELERWAKKNVYGEMEKGK